MNATPITIEVFKTNVHEVAFAQRLVTLLATHFPGSKINFDMHDCDKILRVEGENLIPGNIASIVRDHGFTCIILD